MGEVVYLNLLDTATLKTVEVQTEYLYYFKRNIQSFGSSLICVISDIDETGKRALKLATKYRILNFGLSTLYFLWGRFAPMTVGSGCLPNLVGEGTVENS